MSNTEDPPDMSYQAGMRDMVTIIANYIQGCVVDIRDTEEAKPFLDLARRIRQLQPSLDEIIPFISEGGRRRGVSQSIALLEEWTAEIRTRTQGDWDYDIAIERELTKKIAYLRAVVKNEFAQKGEEEDG